MITNKGNADFGGNTTEAPVCVDLTVWPVKVGGGPMVMDIGRACRRGRNMCENRITLGDHKRRCDRARGGVMSDACDRGADHG
jgi:hypothetical protein